MMGIYFQEIEKGEDENEKIYICVDRSLINMLIWLW